MSALHKCINIHGLISFGACPWCGNLIFDGKNAAEPFHLEAIAKPARWDLSAILQTLKTGKTQPRIDVLDTFLCHPQGSMDTIRVYRAAISDTEKSIRQRVMAGLDRLGSCLTQVEAKAFEDGLQTDGDAALRLALIAYHSLRRNLFETSRRERQEHILWIIEHFPELAIPTGVDIRLDPLVDVDSYAQGKSLWLNAVTIKDRDPEILGNAAWFLSAGDAELSLGLLKKAQVLEPDNPEWPQRIGDLCYSRMNQLEGALRREAALQALAAFEKTIKLNADELNRYRTLPYIACTAFEAGNRDKARNYALELLEKATLPDYFHQQNGYAIHFGNIVLGRLALMEGDIEGSKVFLLNSGKTRGSPFLKTSGPSMALANELLLRGERDVVVQFLQLCTSFWQTNDHRAEKWIYQVQNGVMPDFGTNLLY